MPFESSHSVVCVMARLWKYRIERRLVITRLIISAPRCPGRSAAFNLLR